MSAQTAYLIHRTTQNNVSLPERVALAVNQFILDRKTGNVVLNIRHGEVLGARVEEIIK